mmetsp:Transcript_72182/g.211496  ORF Transcript_72182/g.211496 Transcript_72182/m.211496 type:complete len:227 (-) Transcript_72182:231-911(-)
MRSSTFQRALGYRASSSWRGGSVPQPPLRLSSQEPLTSTTSPPTSASLIVRLATYLSGGTARRASSDAFARPPQPLARASPPEAAPALSHSNFGSSLPATSATPPLPISRVLSLANWSQLLRTHRPAVVSSTRSPMMAVSSAISGGRRRPAGRTSARAPALAWLGVESQRSSSIGCSDGAAHAPAPSRMIPQARLTKGATGCCSNLGPDCAGSGGADASRTGSGAA